MPRENREAKALRLIAAQRVRYAHLAADSALVVVEGDTDSYRLTYLRGRWSCPCECQTTCSHVIAARTIYRSVAPALTGGHNGNHG